MKLRSLFSTILAVAMASASLVADASRIKVLVVTGGHGFEQEPFYKMFSDNA